MSFPAQSWWLEMLHVEKFLKTMSLKYRVNCLSHILGFLIQYLDHNSGLHMHNSGLHMQRKIEISSIKVRKPQTGLLNGEYLRKEWIWWNKSVKCNVKARNEYMQQKKLREKIPPFFEMWTFSFSFFLINYSFFFRIRVENKFWLKKI